LDTSDSLLGFVFFLDSTLSTGGGYSSVHQAVVLTEGHTRFENCGIYAEQVCELLSELFVELLVSSFHRGQVEGEGTCSKLIGSVRFTDESKLHFKTLAVGFNCGLKCISTSSCDIVGIEASLFNSNVLLGQDFHLIGSGLSLECFGANFNLI